MTEAKSDFNLLAIYRAVVPFGVRKMVRPTLLSVYGAFVQRPVPPKELKRLEKQAVQSAARKYKAWQLNAALEELDLVLRGHPDHAGALHLKADILARADRQEEAKKLCRALLLKDPLDIRAIKRLKAMGFAHKFSVGEAERTLIAAGHTPAAYLKAAHYLNEGSMARHAVTFARLGIKACQSRNTDTEQEVYGQLLCEYGLALYAQAHFRDCIKVLKLVPASTSAYNKAVALKAKCLVEFGDGRGAEELLRTIGAYEGGPIGFHVTLVPARLQTGDIKRAHEAYRCRTTSAAIAEYFNMPQDPIDIGLGSGKHSGQDALFVVEGGPGDEIRIASTYNELSTLCRSVTISCEPRLHTLLKRSFSDISFIPTARYRKEILTTDIESRSTLTDQRLYPCVSDDIIAVGRSKQLVCSTLDVLAELRANRSDFRNGSRLTPDPALSRVWRQTIEARKGRKQIGISWRSMLMSQDRSRHYLKVEDLLPLKNLNADFWILQTLVHPDELKVLRAAGFACSVPAIDLKDDFEGQAALISQLDAVLSPLSTMAELSGMVGTKTIIFSRTHETTWRKNEDGSDVWYENGRLVTGDPVSDIPSLISAICSELQAI